MQQPSSSHSEVMSTVTGTTETLTVTGNVVARVFADAVGAAIERRPETLVIDLHGAAAVSPDAAVVLTAAEAHARARAVWLVVLGGGVGPKGRQSVWRSR